MNKRKKKNSVVFVSGNFNVLHPGHIRLLKFARECGDYLIVGVNSDEVAGDDALVPELIRLEGVKYNRWVDEAIIINDSPESKISEIRPSIVVKGKEHENGYNGEVAVLNKYGGQLIFCSGESYIFGFFTKIKP